MNFKKIAVALASASMVFGSMATNVFATDSVTVTVSAAKYVYKNGKWYKVTSAGEEVTTVTSYTGGAFYTIDGTEYYCVNGALYEVLSTSEDGEKVVIAEEATDQKSILDKKATTTTTTTTNKTSPNTGVSF